LSIGVSTGFDPDKLGRTVHELLFTIKQNEAPLAAR